MLSYFISKGKGPFVGSTFGQVTVFSSDIVAAQTCDLTTLSLFLQSLIALGMLLIMQRPFYRNMPKYPKLLWALANKEGEEL